VGRLICLISGTGLSWPDVPHEREARIVAKRVATEICGLDAVKQYIERKIREGSTTDAEDWRFSLQLDPSISYDLEGETKRIFKRLRPYRGALESVLKEERRDPDYKDIDLSRYFDAT
jgi:hypothetical protein